MELYSISFLEPSLSLQGWIQSSSSDFQKSLKSFPNLISQLFIAVHEMNYPSCFTVYYEIKQRRNYSVDHTATPAPPERIGRVSVCAVSSFVDTGTTAQSLGWVGWVGPGCTWRFPQITQNPLPLVRITGIVLRTTQTRL